MAALPRIKELGYQVREVRFVDERGHKVGGFLTDVFGRMTSGRFTSLRRSDLSAAIYGVLDGAVETLFGESIAGIDERRDHVRVRFDRVRHRATSAWSSAPTGCIAGPPDRLRTAVQFEVSLGYHVAAFELEGYRPRDELVYVSHAVPGRQVSRFAMRDDKTLFLFVFRHEYLRGTPPSVERDRKFGARSRVRGCRVGMPADTRGDEECQRHLFRPCESDSNGPVDRCR